MESYGRDFHVVCARVNGNTPPVSAEYKTVEDVVSFYYDQWKYSGGYCAWKARMTHSRKRGREQVREEPASWREGGRKEWE